MHNSAVSSISALLMLHLLGQAVRGILSFRRWTYGGLWTIGAWSMVLVAIFFAIAVGNFVVQGRWRDAMGVGLLLAIALAVRALMGWRARAWVSPGGSRWRPGVTSLLATGALLSAGALLLPAPVTLLLAGVATVILIVARLRSA